MIHHTRIFGYLGCKFSVYDVIYSSYLEFFVIYVRRREEMEKRKLEGRGVCSTALTEQNAN
jgi:hypothetical protein